LGFLNGKFLLTDIPSCAPTLKQARERYLIAATPGALMFVLSGDVGKHVQSLFTDGQTSPVELKYQGQVYYGIPVSQRTMHEPAVHWERAWAGPLSPEYLMHPDLCQNTTRPPMRLRNRATPTYLDSGFGPATVAALYALGYPIKGLPTLAPMVVEKLSFWSRMLSKVFEIFRS
jgi:hypothetical protein